jgi:hypothetical protein
MTRPAISIFVKFHGGLTKKREKLTQKTASVHVRFIEKGLYSAYTLQSMMVSENVQGLLGLLETESDLELKRQIMQMLALMDSEESDEYLFELLEEKG